MMQGIDAKYIKIYKLDTIEDVEQWLVDNKERPVMNIIPDNGRYIVVGGLTWKEINDARN